MHIFVVGAGHVGLVTAIGFGRLGCQVTLTDVDRGRLEQISRGQPPFFEPGMEAALQKALATGVLATQTDPAPPPDAEMSVVCVPTPTDADGLLSMDLVVEVVRALLDATDADHTVVVRSTLPLEGPDRLAEVAGGRGDRPSILVNPEFMREGNALRDFDRPGRVVIGALEAGDRRAADRLAAVYSPLEAPIVITDARSTVLVKIASNVFLATKISFANELARLADAIGADIAMVTEGVGLDDRIGRAFLRPGPGIGGSCLPEQAVALDVEARRRGVPAPLLAAVGASIETHRRALIERVAADLGGSLRGCRVTVLGLSFKAHTDDVRLSPAMAVIRDLRAAGADVVGYDPVAMAKALIDDPGLVTAATPEDAATDADAVIVTTEWPEFASLDWALIASRMRGDLVHDTRGVVAMEAVTAAGLRFVPLGRVATVSSMLQSVEMTG